MEYNYNIYRKYDNGATGVVGGSVGTPSDATFYANLSLITGDFDCAELAIGCSRVDREGWGGVDNSPNLPPVGIFDVIVGENYKSIAYTANTSTQNGCVATKTAEFTVVDGVVGDWIYYADNEETYRYGEIALPSAYEKGKALDTSLRTLPAEYTKQYAYLNRGKVTGAIAFNTFYSIGDSYVKFESGSTFAPPTTENEGVLNVRVAGCYIVQTFSPKNSNALFFRERNEDKTWTSWYTATAGSMVTEDGKGVYVPTFLKRGIGSGYSLAKVYFADEVDNIANYTAGFGIAISGDKVISWTGSGPPFTANAPLSYNSVTGALSLGLLSISQTSGLQAALDSKLSSESDPTVPSWVKAITSTNISNWNTAFGWGDHAGLYPLLSGSYANPTWIASLAFSKITGLPTTLAGYGITNAYTSTQVDSLISAIRQVPTGGTTAQYLRGDNSWQTLNTSVVPEGTNLYYTDARARGAFSPGAGISITSGVIASTITQYTNAMARAAISGTGLLSYNSTTGEMSLSSVPWANVTGAPSFVTQAYATIQSNGTARTQRAVLNFSSEFTAVDNAGSARTDVGISSVDWSKVANAPNFAGLYVPIVRQLTINGTSGRVSVTGGTQSLAASRTWTVDLATIHAGLSGGSGITTPSINVDAYGRVTSLVYSTILFPVTSVNGKTGAVSLSTTDVPEGTNLYYTDARARAAFSAGSGISISGGVISATGSGVSGSGTAPYIPKWISTSAIGNSIMADDGTGIVIGGTASGGYKLRVQGAIYADGDGSAVALYIGSGRAIRSLGEMYIDSPGGNTYFRNGAGYAYSMTLNPSGYVLMGTVTATGSKTLQVNGGIRATGQMQFASYTNAVSFTGIRAGLLGFTSGGDIISVADTDFATAWHNHHGDYYTKTQLNTSGAGGAVHWDNVTNKPSVGLTPHTHPISEVIGLQSALDGKTPWGHGHIIADVSGLQPALDNRPTWGDIYTRSQSDARYLQFESDPHGFDSHWFSVSGSTVTLGIQKRNGAQQYASFNVPSSGGGNYLDKTSGVGNTIYSYNVFEYPTVFNATIQTNGGIYMNSQIFSLFSTQTLGSTPSISNEVLPINVGGVTKYILLKS